MSGMELTISASDQFCDGHAVSVIELPYGLSSNRNAEFGIMDESRPKQ
jgi:hypothetical protein